MKDLLEHLNLVTPLVWLVTDEPDRATDIISQNARRKVFRMDVFDGLVAFVDGEWRKVIVELDGVETTTGDMSVAVHHVVEERGLFIMYNFHLEAEKQLTILNGLFNRYRTAVFENDEEMTPMQVIMLSCSPQIPAEIVRHAALCHLPLPDPAELAGLVTYLEQSSPIDVSLIPEDLDITRVTRRGLGLTEAEFIQACLLSVRELGHIDDEFIHRFKLEKIKEGGILEIRQPKLGLEDIGGLDNAKEIIEGVKWCWDNPEEAERLNIVPLRRLLMVGVPGTGKSAICEATAKTLKLDLAKTGIGANMNMFIGQSESNMRNTFAQIKAMAPLVCWIDEVGRDLAEGSFVGDSGTTQRTHAEFLTGLQELPDNVFLMAAANGLQNLAPEMMRADRFDQIMFVGFPTEEERVEIFNIHLGNEKENHDINMLASSSEFFTGAEIKALVREARFRITRKEKRSVTTSDLLEFIPAMRNRLWLKNREGIQGLYRKAVDEWDWASSKQLENAASVIDGTSEKATGHAPATGGVKFAGFK